MAPRCSYTISDRFRSFLPVVVDVETAGFDAERSALLEVSCMTVNMDGRGYFTPGEQQTVQLLPFPNAEIDQRNLDFIGMKDPFAPERGAVSESEGLKPLFRFVSQAIRANHCTKAILVGHNGHFDLNFIRAAAERLNYKKFPFHPFSVFDTASLSGLIVGQTVLSKACEMFHLPFDEHQAHGAAYDTLMECRLFCALLNRFNTFAGFPESLPETAADDNDSGHTAPQDGSADAS